MFRPNLLISAHSVSIEGDNWTSSHQVFGTRHRRIKLYDRTGILSMWCVAGCRLKQKQKRNWVWVLRTVDECFAFDEATRRQTRPKPIKYHIDTLFPAWHSNRFVRMGGRDMKTTRRFSVILFLPERVRLMYSLPQQIFSLFAFCFVLDVIFRLRRVIRVCDRCLVYIQIHRWYAVRCALSCENYWLLNISPSVSDVHRFVLASSFHTFSLENIYVPMHSVMVNGDFEQRTSTK